MDSSSAQASPGSIKLVSFGFETRLWRQIEVLSPEECWPPTNKAAVEKNKYAQFNLGKEHGFKRVTMPHAVLMVVLGRNLKPSLVTCHTCHHKWCNNPKHLIEGTNFQNAQMNPPEVRARGGLACRGVKKRPEHSTKQRIAQFTSRMRTCECGLQTNAGTMKRHQNASGHSIQGE